MLEKLRQLVIPLYVLLCLLLGGSVQGDWRNMVLQLLAVALIAWAALSRRPESIGRAARMLVLLTLAAVALFVIQLIPLPPKVWPMLPGRDLLAAGYRTLGYDFPWLPVSMAPYETLSTSLTLLPPVAVLLGIIRLWAYEVRWLAGAVLLGTFLHVLLGALQTVGGGWPDAWWYLYDITNPGAVGFFANRNHMGTLLLASLPFSVALFASAVSTADPKRHAMLIVGASGLLLILVGLVLNHSLAAIVLGVPVIAASTLLLPRAWRRTRLAAPLVALAATIAVLSFTNSPVRAELLGSDTSSIEIRQEIWAVTSKALHETFPIGTGLGSFAQVYPLYEQLNEVERTYINHAHNDYLEVALEAGALGVLLIFAFLAWWVSIVVRIWTLPSSGRLARAATIASGAILAHSLADYPLRTAAIAAVFAACLGIMAQAGAKRRGNASSAAGVPRHVVIG